MKKNKQQGWIDSVEPSELKKMIDEKQLSPFIYTSSKKIYKFRVKPTIDWRGLRKIKQIKWVNSGQDFYYPSSQQTPKKKSSSYWFIIQITCLNTFFTSGITSYHPHTLLHHHLKKKKTSRSSKTDTNQTFKQTDQIIHTYILIHKYVSTFKTLNSLLRSSSISQLYNSFRGLVQRYIYWHPSNWFLQSVYLQ